MTTKRDGATPPGGESIPRLLPGSQLTNFPPSELWDDWVEYDAKAWPRKVERRYVLVPTTCFNCEAACGLVAYVDKQTLAIQHALHREPGGAADRMANVGVAMRESGSLQRLDHLLR